MSNNFDNFFYPTSITVIGASQKEKSIGYELLKSIKNYNYRGSIYPVNPKADNILGYTCYKDISDLPAEIDLAIIVVPKQYVDESLDKLLLKGVKHFILITAGFREVGDEGEAAEIKLINKVKSAGGRLIGPNCMGIINSLDEVKLNATFVAEKPEMGAIGFLSQSGALGAAVLNSLRETDIRFSHFVSVGNKADVTENDILDYWNGDKNIRIMTFYLESFADGYGFIDRFIKNEVEKPILIVKAGRTAGGMKAASSHTGALGSNDKVTDAILKQFGIIRTETIGSLFNCAKGFDNFTPPKGNKVAIVTNAGGPAILATDSLERNKLTLAEFSSDTKSKLREIVHPEGSINNPVDLLPGGSAEQFRRVNEIIAEDDSVDAIISIFVEPVMVNAFPVVEGINEVKSNKPILQVVMPLPEFWEEYKKKSSYRKPLFRNPEDPAEVLGNMLFYKRDKRQYLRSEGKGFKFKQSEGFLSSSESDELSRHYSFPIVKSSLYTAQQLEVLGAQLEYPVVLKGLGEKVIHKSEFNAVKIDIRDPEQLYRAANEMIESFKRFNVQVEQFMVQKFYKARYELLIGGFRDSTFGPVIMFGTGGKYVEVINDTSIKSAHLSEEDLDEIIFTTKIGEILKGVRGEKEADIKSVKELIKNAALMMLENKEIKEFDFNPVLITEENEVVIVDVRIRI
jgi:acetate---CoA ligase (ADP-forming)